MPIKINGSTSGSTTITAPATGSDETIELSSALAAKATISQLKILQVVEGTYETAVSTTSTSYVDTGLTATITPSSATNKVLVIVSQAMYVDRSSNLAEGAVQLVRGATGIQGPGTTQRNLTLYVAGATTAVYGLYVSMMRLDSPASTSPVTYKMQMRSSGTYSTTLIAQRDSAMSSIVLIEVKA